MILYELTPAVKDLSETFREIIQRRIAEDGSDWRKAQAELKGILSPQGRIDAASRRMKSAQAISHLLTSHNLITQ